MNNNIRNFIIKLNRDQLIKNKKFYNEFICKNKHHNRNKTIYCTILYNNIISSAFENFKV